MQGVEWMKVRLLEHDPVWSEEFLHAKQLILKIWTDNVQDIQHVGSTSIHGISAKPILDIGVVLRDFRKMDMEAMEKQGYRYMGPRNEAGDRHLFILYVEQGEHKEIALQHIHCYPMGSDDFKALVGFRDYLNEHPDEAAEYDALKRELATKYANDRFAYSDGKKGFIEKINSRLRL